MAVVIVGQRIAGAVGGATVQAAIDIAKNLHKRYVSLQTNERQRDEICSKVTTLQGILQSAMETAVDTRDDLTRQTLWNIQQKLRKCLEICEEIEKQPIKTKFQNAPDDIKRVEELSRLLDESISLVSLHFSVSNYTTLSAIEQSMRHVKQGGVYQLNSECRNKPEKVKKPTVKEENPGKLPRELHVCWKKISVDYYELEYNSKCSQVKSNECKIETSVGCFSNNNSYKIHVRGVNGRGPGEWSETTAGAFTVLPEQPHKPIAVYVNSSTSITLVVKKPGEREGAKPVTHFVVEYHTENDSGMIQKVFSIENLETMSINSMQAFKINLNGGAGSTYYVKIKHKNQDGDSSSCEEDTIRVDTIPPGEPVGLTVVHTTTRTIIIEWSKPETSEYMVDHYEVQWGRNGNINKKRTTPRSYAVFRQLQTNKKYLFKVRAVNKMGYGSEFIEIDAETKSMAGKVAKALGAGAATGAATTVMSPFSAVITGVAAGAGAGAAAAESVEDKGKGAEVAAGAAAGIGGGVAGFALGLLITPFVIVASPFVGTATGISAVVGGDEAELNEFLEKYPDDSKDIDIK